MLKSFFSKTTSSSVYETFAWVFLPTFLTLLSMGFFLRMGWIVAVTGLTQTFCLISIATAISVITALSISSMMTNIKMETGGIYFLLSRTFGIEVGSAISLPLFLAQAFSASFYAIGLAEILHILFPILLIKETTLVLLLLMTLIVLISPQLVLKTQFFLFICVCFTLLSFYLGPVVEKPLEAISSKGSFWLAFAMFFPVVTGIEGSLALIHRFKKPSLSIPLGILSALACAFFIYISTAYLLALKAPHAILLNEPLVMEKLSLVPSIVLIGVLASSFSAALASILSASTTLQAFAEDKIIPKFFSYTKNSSPIFAILATIVVAVTGIFFGSLNALAPLLSIFFLIAYGMLSAATTIETVIENPSWRPTLKLPWFIPLTGALLCCSVMLMINPGMGLLATLLISCVHFLMKKRHIHSSWQDLRYSILLFLSRYAIYELNTLEPSPKTWRPNLLVFMGDPLLRAHLTELTGALTHKKGFLIISSILPSEASTTIAHESHKLSLFLEKTHTPALVKTQYAPTLLTGMKTLIETLSLGQVTPNTIVLGASDKEEKKLLFAEVIRFAYENKKNVIMIRENALKTSLSKKTIDIWWGGQSRHNSELMVVLAYMLQTSYDWKGSTVTLKTAVNILEDAAPMQNNLDTFLKTSRLQLKTDIILHKEGDILTDTIKQHSNLANLVFLGLRPPEAEESTEHYAEYYITLLKKTEGFPTVAYVLASEDLEFSQILR
ncbi:MAG: amino acid permease [Chlamydiota bacterium]